MKATEQFFSQLQSALFPAGKAWPVPPGLRPAGVLVPLRMSPDGEAAVVLARRTEQVPHHKGQICFPGGSRDPGDRDLLATAVRESEEELGIREQDLQLLGTMEPVPTVTGFFIQPFLATIPAQTRFRLDPFEIAEVFEVPVAVFTDMDRYRAAETTFLGRPYHVYFLDYGPHTIWGATARILHNLAEVALRRPRSRFAAL